MAAGDVIIQADGAYVDVGDGRLLRLTGAPRVTTNSGAVVRWPARNTTIVAPIDHGQTFNMRDAVMMAIAIMRSGVTFAELQAIAPGVAAVLQGQGVTEGAVD